MTENFDSLKEFSLQTRALHELAKACWGDFVLKLPFDDVDYRDENDFVDKEKKKIVDHRKTVVKRISETFSSSLPKILKDQLVDAVIRMQRGYHEALFCTERDRSLTTLSKLNPMTSGPYSAKNFIDPNGRFDELAWAKRYVSDENRSAFHRFELACRYCFEETIQDLWYSTISKGMHPFEGNFRDIFKKSCFFVAVWVCRLENKFDEVVGEETKFADGFYVGGFRKAMHLFYEYASRFFWARCSDTEKSNLMSEIYEHVLNEELCVAAFLGYSGYVNFIYSLLSLEQKRNLILNIENYDYGLESILSCLLLSPFYESVLNDIKTLSVHPSNYTYGYILWTLTSAMLELPIPEYKKVLDVLWKPLSEIKQKEILHDDTSLFRNLTKLKHMDLLETIIRPIPRSEKERMLLYDWKYAGMSTLDEFSKVGDYDAMVRYLLLFLTDQDPVTQKLRVRDDASDLLDRLTSGDIFILWTKGQVPETEKRKVREVIRSLQVSLNVLHSLLDRVEEIHSGGTKSTDFSDTEKEHDGLVTGKLKHSMVDHTEGTIQKKPKLSSLL